MTHAVSISVGAAGPAGEDPLLAAVAVGGRAEGRHGDAGGLLREAGAGAVVLGRGDDEALPGVEVGAGALGLDVLGRIVDAGLGAGCCRAGGDRDRARCTTRSRSRRESASAEQPPKLMLIASRRGWPPRRSS